MKKTLRIGTNRGHPRIWIEGQALAAMGWKKGTAFHARFHEGFIEYVRAHDGDRHVAGTDQRPIIDTNSERIADALGPATHVRIEVRDARIVITPTAPPGKLAGAVAAIAIAAASLAAPYLSQFAPGAQRVLVACEESAAVRNAFTRLGHDAVSCDLMDTRDPSGWHAQADVTPFLAMEWDLVIGFPPCPYLTNSAEWAFKDPDFDRYPGVGYHQRPQPGTLTGEARRKARLEAAAFARAIYDSCRRSAIENPVGALSRLFRPPDQKIQPYQFGHPESKGTCLWLRDLPSLIPTDELNITLHGWLAPGGKWRWLNQTAGGQNKLPPSLDRAKIRSTTYPGIAAAMAAQWGGNALRIQLRRRPLIPSSFI